MLTEMLTRAYRASLTKSAGNIPLLSRGEAFGTARGLRWSETNPDGILGNGRLAAFTLQLRLSFRLPAALGMTSMFVNHDPLSEW